MQYKVPQDVQREDTIIGPITLKQLGILGAGGFLTYGIYISLAPGWKTVVWLPPTAISAALTLAFAFLKVHSMPFHLFIMNFIEYHVLAKKRIWLQGSGDTFISSFDRVKKKEKIEEVKSEKNEKSIDELSKILDSYNQ